MGNTLLLLAKNLRSSNKKVQVKCWESWFRQNFNYLPLSWTFQEIQGKEIGRAGPYYSPSPFMVKSWPYSSITIVLNAERNTWDDAVRIDIL